MELSLFHTMTIGADKKETIMVTLGIEGDLFEGSFQVSDLFIYLLSRQCTAGKEGTRSPYRWL